MKRMMVMEEKRGLYSIGFYVAIVLVMVAGLLGAREVISHYREIGVGASDIRFLGTAYQAVYSESFALILPIACTLAMSASFLEDMQSRALYHILLRTTKKQYLGSKVLLCGAFGALITILGAGMVIVACFCLFPIKMVELQNFSSVGIPYLLWMGEKLMVLALNGIFYALLGGGIATFVNNKYMAYASPFIFYYVISTLCTAYLSDYRLINPKEWLMLQSTPTWLMIIILLVINSCGIVGYLIAMERRWRNE